MSQKYYIQFKESYKKKYPNFPIVFEESSYIIKYIKKIMKEKNISKDTVSDLKQFICSIESPLLLLESNMKCFIQTSTELPDYDISLIDNELQILDKIELDPKSNNAPVIIIKKIILLSKAYDINTNDKVKYINLLENLMNDLEPFIKLFSKDTIKNIDNFNKWLREKRDLQDKEDVFSDFDTFISNLESIGSSKNDTIVFNNKDATRIKLDQYQSPSNKNFTKFINSTFTNTSISEQGDIIRSWNKNLLKGVPGYSDDIAFPHQKFVSDYLNENTPYKGLLLYHGLGSGKTGGSVLISEGYTNKTTVVMLPASIRRNFETEIVKFGQLSYKKMFNWKFYVIPEYREELIKIGINEELYDTISSNKIYKDGNKRGLWLINYSIKSDECPEPNFDVLTPEDKESLSVQIEKLIGYKYKFCHYNAGKYTLPALLEKLVPDYRTIYSTLLQNKKKSSLNDKDIDKLLSYVYTNNINPLDDKVIIIDEIHNFTSGLTGSGYNNIRLYELILRSKRSNIVFLSGTPMINSPYELGLMFNMIKGMMKSYKMILNRKIGLFDVPEITKILSEISVIDQFNINKTNKEIQITRTPYGFIKKYSDDNKYIGLIKDSLNEKTESEFISYILDQLNNHEYEKSRADIQIEEFTLFNNILKDTNEMGIRIGSHQLIENAETQFNSLYVDENSNTVKNADNIKDKLMGLVSFYNEVTNKPGEDPLFPDKIIADTDKTVVEMSNFQFVNYSEARQIERELEDRLKIKHNAKKPDSQNLNNDKIPNLFKVYTRQRGIFVFPKGIERPKPMKYDKLPSSRSSDKATVIRVKKSVTDKLSYINEEINKIYEKCNNDKDKYTDNIEQFLKDLVKKTWDIPELTIYEVNYKTLFIIVYNFMFSTDFKNTNELINFLKASEELSILINNNISELLINYEKMTQLIDLGNTISYENKCDYAMSMLTHEHLTVNDSPYNLSILSPKYAKILENLKETRGPVIVYSQYRKVEGIEIFTKVLDANGFVKFGKNHSKENTIKVGSTVRYIRKVSGKNVISMHTVTKLVGNDLYECTDLHDPIDKKNISLCKYALWTGSESVEERDNVLKEFNSGDNIYGNNCLIILITKSGSEGISLKYIRQVHIMEPYWNNVRINQVIGRARRIKSHIDLPIEDRNVEVFKYTVKYTNEQKIGSWLNSVSDKDINTYFIDNDSFSTEKEAVDYYKQLAKIYSHSLIKDDSITSDEVLQDISDKKENILNQFQDILKEVSIDCSFNRESNVLSDKSLSRIKCYNGSTYEKSLLQLKDTNTSGIINKTVPQKKTVKEIVIPLPVVDPKSNETVDIKLIMRIPEDQDEWNESSDKTPIYDYYKYNGLVDINSESLEMIGTFNKKITGEISFSFNQNFIHNLDFYIEIEKCIQSVENEQSKKSETNKPFIHLTEESDKKEFIELVSKCLKSQSSSPPLSLESADAEDKWICPGCDTKISKGEECIKCGIDESDLD
tara:strand:- start:278 stop:4708 length:4431 start_codon:yes stop_codon:yes gene_type:complete